VSLVAGNLTWPAVGIGVVMGLVYTLSPLSVLAIAAGIAAAAWASRDFGPRERHWFLFLITVAMVMRFVLIAALFLAADDSRPFATFFGDEELFKSRPIWIRNIGLGVPISPADFIYAYDDTGRSGYLLVLAVLQAFVGDAPYAIHILNAVVYLGGALLLHRIARASFGPLPAIGGFTVLLFFPSLFAWSISALKEPMYVFVAAVELLCVLTLVRSRTWTGRVAALVGVVITAFMLESLRKGGSQVAMAGAVAGIAGGLIVPRPKLFLATALIVPLAIVAALQVPRVQDRVLTVVRDSVRYHAGHVLTAGHTYQLVNPHYYSNWEAIFKIGPAEATQYVSRAVVRYFVEPLPWIPRSRAMLAYVPEQAAWWSLLLVVPFGIAAGLKRDALLTSVLLSHAVAIIMMVALTSGNIGTLIRHRGLVLPYLVWIAALGAYWLLEQFTRQTRISGGGDDGDR
jgi:hypothetical protein